MFSFCYKYYEYKITGALPAATLHEVMNKGIINPAGIVNDVGAVASIISPFAENPVPYFTDTIEPVINDAGPIPRDITPAKEPVADCPAVKMVPPKFTGIFAILFYFVLVLIFK
jgi:hypothetical protein